MQGFHPGFRPVSPFFQSVAELPALPFVLPGGFQGLLQQMLFPVGILFAVEFLPLLQEAVILFLENFQPSLFLFKGTGQGFHGAVEPFQVAFQKTDLLFNVRLLPDLLLPRVQPFPQGDRQRGQIPLRNAVDAKGLQPVFEEVCKTQAVRPQFFQSFSGESQCLFRRRFG